MTTLPLPGCTPEPLMSYLKALGVFRLVAEQADPDARLSWKGGVAVLDSRLDRDTLTKFLLEDYEPTPIVVPWSGSDFFGVNLEGNPGPHKKTPTSTRVIEAILATDSRRLREYRETIRCVCNVMIDCGVNSKSDIEGTSKKAVKANLIAVLRGRVVEKVVDWIDAAAQPDDASSVFNPLLGSGGGNDGNTHFSDNFMQNLWDCLPDFDHEREKTNQPKPSVRHALFNDHSGNLVERTGALYDSGAVGGPNATQGFIREFLVNPWTFILALEGLLIFAGGLAKKLGSHSDEAPSFPFLIRLTAAGSDFGSAATKEYGQHEIWLPIWERQATHAELAHFFREGRAQVNRRPAQTGTDMARAVSTKGVSAGIDEFRRFGLIRGRVGGENYFTATSVGRYRVRYESSVTLVNELDPWLTRFGFLLRDDDTPARYRSQFQQLDSVITDCCRGNRIPGQQSSLTPVLAELGSVERTLAAGLAFCKKHRLKPLQGLSSDWLDQADDGSREFRLAAALAGIGAASSGVGPFRVYLEEVEFRGHHVTWSPGSTSAVWSNRSLHANLAAVFRRRQVEAFRDGIAGVPIRSTRWAPLADVVAFLNGEIDDEKLAALLWALPALEWSAIEFRSHADFASPSVPVEFAIPRLLVEPLPFVATGGYWQLGKTNEPTTPDPDVFHVLASGRTAAISQTVERAARRLRSGGRIVVGYRNRQTAGKPLGVASSINPERLLAAMLVPLSPHDLEVAANIVLYPPESKE
jgi:CRISPR-associated protein Csx17